METRSLNNIISLIKTGKTPPTKEGKYFNGEINWYTPSDLDKSKYLTKAKRTITNFAIEDKKVVMFPKNTLLIGCVGDIGKIGITTELSSSNQQLTGVVPNQSCYVGYLYYWFKGNKRVLEKHSNTSVVPILNNKSLLSLKIPLPPLDQQKKISAILDAADAYRQKTKALIEKYDELTQSLFLDMFGDPVTNPKGWLKLKLSEFCEFENGDRSSNYPSGNDIINSGKLFLSSGDIQKGKFRVKDSKYISQEKFDSLKRGKCRSGDVLMTLRGNGTGKSAVFKCEFEEGFINAQMVIIRPDERCLSAYLVLQLNCPPVFKRLVNLNSGSAQPQLSASNVKDFEVLVPEIKLQSLFAERVQAIETQKKQVEESLAKAEDLFNSLLQRAFKGELV